MPDHADPVLDIERVPLVLPADSPRRDQDGGAVPERRDAPASRDAAPQPTEPQRAPLPPAGPTTISARRKAMRWILMTLGPVAVVAVALVLTLAGGRIVSIDDAYVRADTVDVSTDVGGLVAEVAVQDNQRVAPGDVLFRLDDRQFRIALAGAEAQLGVVRDDLTAMQASYRQQQAAIRQAQVDIDFFQREYDRQADLVRRAVSPVAQFDAARRNLEDARQSLANFTQALAAIVANLAGNPDAPIEQHPRYLAAAAARDEAARQLSHTVVRAPFAGVVALAHQLQPGEYLPAAQTAFELVAIDGAWIEAEPKETELTYVRAGQPVTFTVDTYPGLEWRGTVESLSPASGGSFSLLPPQNTSGNWVKVVQRIPVRLHVDPRPDLPPLRAGMSVVAAIDTGHRRRLGDILADVFGWGGAAAAPAPALQ
jgi:membrane fusion protein (multidrug efflux system)